MSALWSLVGIFQDHDDHDVYSSRVVTLWLVFALTEQSAKFTKEE